MLDQSSDLTLAPIITQNARHRADRRVPPPRQQRLHADRWRWHLRGVRRQREQGSRQAVSRLPQDFGGYSVSDNSIAGFDVFLASDNTFLDRYQISDSDVLRSRVYLEGSENRNFWSLNGYYFQGLRPFDDQDKIPVALPLAETRLVSDRMRWGSYFTADSNVLALTRNRGLDTRRVSNTVGWTLPYLGADRRRLPARRQHARRHLQHRRQSTDLQLGWRPEIGGSLPAARDRRLELAAGRRHRRLGPRGRADGQRQRGADLRQHAQDPERGQHGLRVRRDQPVPAQPVSRARPDRYRVQGRLRPALQHRWARAPPSSAAASGRATRSPTNEFIPDNSGLQHNLSDYVGAFYFRPSGLLDLSYRFRIGKSDLQFRRSDALASFGPAFLRFNLGYLNLSKEPEAFDDDSGTDSNPSGFDPARRSRSAPGSSSPTRSPSAARRAAT